MTLKGYINQYLIEEIKAIQDSNHHYLSFFLISSGIELLGACIDKNQNFWKENRSRKRFDMCIQKLFPTDYHQYNNRDSKYYIYSDLRCGLLHSTLPKKNLELIQQKEAKQYHLNHLQVCEVRGNKRLILVSEDFYKDFKNACNKLIEMIDKDQVNNIRTDKEIFYTSCNIIK